MTTLMLVDADEGATKSQAITLRLRQEFARKGLSVSEVARRMGTSQPRIWRRMAGETPWDVNELDELCAKVDISFVYVTTGIKPVPDAPGDAYLIRKYGPTIGKHAAHRAFLVGDHGPRSGKLLNRNNHRTKIQ